MYDFLIWKTQVFNKPTASFSCFIGYVPGPVFLGFLSYVPGLVSSTYNFPIWKTIHYGHLTIV